MYDAAFKGVKGIKKLPYNSAERLNAYWWYPILIDTDKLDIKADKFLKALLSKNIPCYGIQWPEAYQERAYVNHGGFGTAKFPFDSKEYTNPDSVKYDQVNCPHAKKLRDETVCLFLHPSWEKVHIERCIAGFLEVLKEHTK
jgi:dTDP-4-amino-4,6-dideoxygalactose transaminase